MASSSYYEPTGENTWRPTEHVQGAWNAHEQHMAPVAGLIAHALETHAPRPDLRIGRITYEILGLMPLEETRITCRTVRPGRTIELVEAEMTTVSSPDRPVVRASAWRLAVGDTAAIAGNLPAPMPGPAEIAADPSPEATVLMQRLASWPGGFIRSLQAHVTPAPATEPGVERRLAWLCSDTTLLPATPDGGSGASEFANFLRLVDTANGIAARVDPREWLFPNTDLTVHLWRTPAGPWVGLDTSATLGPDGVGVTQTVLHDEQGPVGRAAQVLTIRPIPTGAPAGSGHQQPGDDRRQ